MFERLDSQEHFALRVMEKEEIREMDLGNPGKYKNFLIMWCGA